MRFAATKVTTNAMAASCRWHPDQPNDRNGSMNEPALAGVLVLRGFGVVIWVGEVLSGLW